jgi:hypothetical protein
MQQNTVHVKYTCNKIIEWIEGMQYNYSITTVVIAFSKQKYQNDTLGWETQVPLPQHPPRSPFVLGRARMSQSYLSLLCHRHRNGYDNYLQIIIIIIIREKLYSIK